MKRLFYILIVLVCALAVAGCSEKDVFSKEEVKDEKSKQESRAMEEEKKEQSGSNSFAAIQEVGNVYMLVDQTYELHVDSPSFEYVPRGVHILIANPTDQAQDLRFLKEIDHAYADGEEQTNMTMEAGVFGEDFPAALEAGAVMSTYYVYYWPLFEPHDKGWLTFAVNGTASRFPLTEPLDDKLFSEVRTHIYRFDLSRQAKQQEFHEREETLRAEECSYFSSELDTCTFVGQSNEITGFTLQDGTVYIYPHGRSVGKVVTTYDEDKLAFYFDAGGLLRVETVDGREVNITPELFLIFAKIEELAKFILEEAARKAVAVSPEDRLSADEANHAIINTIRPASQTIEHAINQRKIKGEVSGETTTYQLGNIKKVVKDFGSHTMSATYIDDVLTFVLRVDPATKQMVRYYFAENQLIRILSETGEMVHFEDAADRADYLRTEQALLAEY